MTPYLAIAAIAAGLFILAGLIRGEAAVRRAHSRIDLERAELERLYVPQEEGAQLMKRGTEVD